MADNDEAPARANGGAPHAATAAPRIHLFSLPLNLNDGMVRLLSADANAQCVSSLRRKSTNRDVLLGY